MPLYKIRLVNGETGELYADTPEQALHTANMIYVSPPDVIVAVDDSPTLAAYDAPEEPTSDLPAWDDYARANGLYPYNRYGEEDLRIKGAKHDGAKYKPSLCKIEPLVRAICQAREYGMSKYQESEDWESIDSQRWREALVRHVLAENDDPGGYDDESGLPRMCHIAFNVMALLSHYQI